MAFCWRVLLTSLKTVRPTIGHQLKSQPTEICMSTSLVIIPTYNERENIEEIARHVLSLASRFDVLVVDDGSPDGTAGIVKTLQTEFPNRLYLEERSGKLGIGTAYIHGFRWGLDRGIGIICSKWTPISVMTRTTSSDCWQLAKRRDTTWLLDPATSRAERS